MFDWMIEVEDRGIVRLTGEEPLGYPCETYLNDSLIERSEDGSWAWTTEARVPTPVYMIDKTIERWDDDARNLSYFIDLEVRGLWEKFMNNPEHSDAFRARTAAFVQYGRNRHLEVVGRPLPRYELYG